MTEANTQAVVQDAPVSAQPDTNAANARDDLATILSTYEDETKPQTPQPAPQPKAAPDPVLERVNALETRQTNLDIDSAVNAIREGHDHITPRLVKGWLNAAAEENPKLKDIFNNRYSDPAKWDKALKALKSEFNKEQAKRPDPAATEDREAVAAAVRGASSKAPPDQAPNYGAMTDAEFQKEKAKLGF